MQGASTEAGFPGRLSLEWDEAARPFNGFQRTEPALKKTAPHRMRLGVMPYDFLTPFAGNNAVPNQFSLKRLFTICSLSLMVSILSYCTAEDPGNRWDQGKKPFKTKTYENHDIPVFQTALKQLNYALTRYSDDEEKASALRVVLELFPQARRESAEACLALAYLTLGSDFRFADISTCRRTIGYYEKIIGDFPDMPGICAKALWYIGWIYTDLLKERRKGIETYRKVVAQYPDEGFLPFPRLAWQASFVDGEKEIQPLAEKEFWAALALLEIIRCADHADEKLMAGKKLIQSYPSCLSTGYAVLILLDEPALEEQVFEMAKACLNSGMPYPAVIGNIQKKMESKGLL
jgi:hypothetical protein